MAICRRLIEALGGLITVESALNRGSIFTISLPPSCIVCDLDSAREPCACVQASRPADEPDGASGRREEADRQPAARRGDSRTAL